MLLFTNSDKRKQRPKEIVRIFISMEGSLFFKKLKSSIQSECIKIFPDNIKQNEYFKVSMSKSQVYNGVNLRKYTHNK